MALQQKRPSCAEVVHEGSKQSHTRGGDYVPSAVVREQVLTLENWADGIARHVLSKQPGMVIFFVLFLMSTGGPRTTRRRR